MPIRVRTRRGIRVATFHGGQTLVATGCAPALHQHWMLKCNAVKPPIRLLAIDIDGTLLSTKFQISQANLDALRRAHEAGVEVVLVTGRRHTFALPIADMLGFDLWLISSNGAVTKSMRGEHFHCDFLPLDTARKLCASMTEFRGQTVLTFDREGKGAIVLEHMDDLNQSIQR